MNQADIVCAKRAGGEGDKRSRFQFLQTHVGRRTGGRGGREGFSEPNVDFGEQLLRAQKLVWARTGRSCWRFQCLRTARVVVCGSFGQLSMTVALCAMTACY